VVPASGSTPMPQGVDVANSCPVPSNMPPSQGTVVVFEGKPLFQGIVVAAINPKPLF
jgi:hypothetical protein